MKTIAPILIAVCAVICFPGSFTTAIAATLASDNASDSTYVSGWASGGNGGSGFVAWTLTTGGGLGGFFTGPSVNNAAFAGPGIDTGGRSWGMWASGGGSAVAFRAFANPLAVGQVLQLDMDNGYIEDGGVVGFTIRTGNAAGGSGDCNTGARFEFKYVGFDAVDSYKVTDAGGVRNVGVPFTGTGLRLTFVLDSATTYTFRVVNNATGATNTLTGALQDAAPLQSVALYNLNAGPDSDHDAFFNSLGVTGEAVTALRQSAVDTGGRRVTASGVSIEGSIGGIGHVAAAGGVAMNGGYAAQLPVVTNVVIAAAPVAVDEGDSVQLAGAAVMDDASVTPLAGPEIAWSSPAYPVLTISSAGLAETMQVYAGVNACVTGRYFEVASSGMFQVRDANSDNFGIYAADGVPDGWQVQWFGVHNFAGNAHANPDGDAYDNLQEWIALTDPTNPASAFRIVALSNLPPHQVVYFNPASTGRVYTLQYSTDLLSGIWSNVTSVGEWGNGGVFWLNDTSAASPRFYRVSVQAP